MFEKIKNIYNLPSSGLTLRSVNKNSISAENKRKDIIHTLNTETTNK
jgi:hypothetical protein